jgi:ABC-2 type transport system ATP-binding protein
MADRIVILFAGRVVREGTVHELTTAGTATTAVTTFGAPPGLDVASLAAAVGLDAAAAETSPGRYLVESPVAGSGPAVTAAIATWLAERGAALTDLTTGRSVVDVYVDAVGSAATDAAGTAPDPPRRGRRSRRTQ